MAGALNLQRGWQNHEIWLEKRLALYNVNNWTRLGTEDFLVRKSGKGRAGMGAAIGKVRGICTTKLSTAKGATIRRETMVVYRRTASLCYGQLIRNTVLIRHDLNPDGWLVQWRLTSKLKETTEWVEIVDGGILGNKKAIARKSKFIAGEYIFLLTGAF